ncbi:MULTISPECIES: LysR family transcriptional regulator [Paraburkholderia]|uniref:LysR family transcriptional regulator n=1 Tax=Paraburkholderia tropica TaxID=92647 RepID=A0A1A5XIQ1_9BURK|nr:LysR family transcriptional regulator [Paraburkholderia tropica]MBB2979839.1 DNA-binding transcriptional LysR family regulator [Paraburkholderia tropica]MBB3000561.1 DNA-binding transcriptional LysR family regulator [Paraburkholderia tropica]MBB6320190.1 DNA-binding transcriptional LysR family regulator [Paraburkholderia tropica]MDE1143685.1 LysR family transcriptional regulator [Paraburkholderia tropica]OBR53307.1 LysR family transcriptional regulator [Paraburkholderia tropica]
MNSDDLAVFAHVAKTGSISRTAMELGANQSTVSRRIAVLEAELGVRLFRRSGRGVGLTERGAQLLGYAQTLERTLDEARGAMRSGVESGPARLVIAAQPTIARIMFASLGHRLRARYPNTRVRFIEGLASQILGRLSDGEIDLAVMYVPEHRGAMQFDTLLAEQICLVAPANYALPEGLADVSLLGQVPLILPSTHHGLRVLVESLAARHGFTPRIVLECDGSISLTKRLVIAQCGCTVLPAASVIEEVADGRLQCVPLDNPVVMRDVAIAWPQNRTMPDGVWSVAQMIRDVAADLVTSGDWPGTALTPGTPDEPHLSEG